jgi:hypothetical protein
VQQAQHTVGTVKGRLTAQLRGSRRNRFNFLIGIAVLEAECGRQKRLLVNIEAHGIATARTLEQKISDGGPFNQRVDPHVLTPVRNRLVDEGKINTRARYPVTRISTS